MSVALAPRNGARERRIHDAAMAMLTRRSARAPVVRHIRRNSNGTAAGRAGRMGAAASGCGRPSSRGVRLWGALWTDSRDARTPRDAAQGVGVGIAVSDGARPNFFIQRLIGLAAITVGVHSRLLVPRRCTATSP